MLERNAEILGLQPPVKEFMVTAYMSTSRAVILIWFLINDISLLSTFLNSVIFQILNIITSMANSVMGITRLEVTRNFRFESNTVTKSDLTQH